MNATRQRLTSRMRRPATVRLGGALAEYPAAFGQMLIGVDLWLRRPVEVALIGDPSDPAMREMPIGMRVVKGTNESEDETVSLLRPAYHPDGVIRGETSLDQGLYTVIITAEGLPPLRYQYPLRVQMINYASIFRTAVGPLIGLLVLALLIYKLMKSGRMQRWRSRPRP